MESSFRLEEADLWVKAMAFEFIRYVIRNPTELTRGVRRLFKIRKSVSEFRKWPANKFCAWCGRDRKLEVHHIVPVSVSPELAGDKKNMIMLCRKPACHQIIGHNGDFRSRYVENVKELCRSGGKRVVKTISFGE